MELLLRRLTEKRQELTRRMENLQEQMLTKDDCSLADAADAATPGTGAEAMG